jgi:hypothetical protein
MAKRQRERRVHPDATRIGAAMNDGVCHGLTAPRDIRLGAAPVLNKTGNSTHGNSSLMFDLQPD